MFIPYRVDVPFDRRPVMNWLVFLAVSLVFALQVIEIAQQLAAGTYGQPQAHSAMQQFVLKDWSVKGLLGYMWLHRDIIHLIGNLLFLWLFGNAVCSKLGSLLYLPVYLSLGLVAGISHLLFANGPVLGASGAINGLVGMYLVFFPENSISCFFWLLWYPVRFSVSGYWMILLWFAFDLLGLLRGTGGVAYVAHVGGFLAGLVLAIALLKTRIVVMHRDEKSLLEMLGLDRSRKPAPARGDLTFWQHRFDVTRDQPVSAQPPAVPIKFDSDDVKDDFVRFTCSCGQRVKVDKKYAGKIGRCPYCSNRVQIPQS